MVALIARADLQSAAWLGGRPHRASTERDREYLSEPDRVAELAETDGELLGLAAFWPRDDRIAHLGYLFVDPGHQGRRVGRVLLERALAEMRRRGFTRAQLRTPVLNARARRFYEREGWSDTGGRHRNEEIGLEMAHYARST